MNLIKMIRQWNKHRLEKRRASQKKSYAEWIRSYDIFDLRKIRLNAQQHQELHQGKLFSIVMVLDKPRHVHVHDGIKSVKRQIYNNWELLITPAVNIDDTTKAAIMQLMYGEPRIKYLEGIPADSHAAAYNLALENSSGDYIALLGPDDEIPAHALLLASKATLQDPSPAMIYTDEDQISAAGERSRPQFKPEWNEYLIRSQCYTRNFLLFKKTLANSVQGFKDDGGMAGIHDFILRCSEKTTHSDIAHIPFVLYHARKNSSVQDRAAFIDTEGSLRAVQAHLDRLHIKANTKLVGSNVRVVYGLPDPAPKVSIIIPSRDRPELLRTCVTSVLEKTKYPDFELIFVDNNTTDADALAWIENACKRDNFKLIKDPLPFNYSRINNLAVKACSGAYVCLMNNDVEVTDADWLAEMVSIGAQPDVGVVGARLLYPNAQLQHAGIIVGVGSVAGHAFKNSHKADPSYMDRAILLQEYSAVTAACLVTAKSNYARAGGLNEQDLGVALNDVDYCLKIRKMGLKVIYTPYAEHIHHESASRGNEDTPEKKARFREESRYIFNTWQPWLENDPAYNPNLTIKFEDFSLASPPRIDFMKYLSA